MEFEARNMLIYCCTVLLVSAFMWSDVSAQGAVSTNHRLNTENTGEAWDYNNYPNPRTEHQQCGRSRASWICDPDGILTTAHADELDLLIGAIRKATPCPCGIRSCSSNQAGYTISMAIMNKMYRVNNDFSSVMADARSFAFALEKERWQFDRCDEDILIVFSLRDNIVFAVTGLKAREKIGDATLHEIVIDSTQFFQHNPYMGLKHMIYAIRHALTDRIHVYRGEKRHLSQVYSYQRARPRSAGSASVRGEGQMVGSYSSSADPIRSRQGLHAFVVFSCLSMLLTKNL